MEVVGTVKATSFVGDGSGLTNLPNASLSTNVALRSGGNAFTGNQSVMSGSVGIGTASPLVPFEVRVNDNNRSALFSGPNGASFSFYNTVGGGNPYLWDLTGDTNAFALAISGVGYPFLVKKSTGFVGINNTTPTTALDVGGTVKATAFVGDGSGLTNLPNATLSTNVALRSGGNAFTGNQSMMSGTVGVGTTSPAAPLEVSGGNPSIGVQTLQVSGPGGAMTKYHSTTGGLDWDIYAANGGYAISRSGIDFPFIIDGGSGNIGVGTGTPSNKLEVVGTVKATSFVGNGSGLTGISVNVANVSGAAKLAGGNAFTGNQSVMSGTVGVGTTTPGAPLEVSGGNSTAGSPTLMLSSPSGAMTKFHSTGGGLDWDVYASTNGYAISRSGIDFPFLITADTGRIGIGTTTPTTKLDVVGTVKATAFVGDGSGLTNLPNATLSTNVALLNGTNLFTGPNTLNGVVTATNANNVFVGSFIGNGSGLTGLNANNLSSGTIALAQLPATVVLNGAGGLNLSGTFSGNGAGLTNLNVNATNFAGVAKLSGGNTFNGTQNITNGSLGIGTTSPLTPLEVRVTSGRAALFSGPSGASFSFYDTVGGGNPYLWDMSGDTNAFALAISGVGYPFLVKKSNGFVGINNTTPSYQLDVLGTSDTTVGRFRGSSSSVQLQSNPGSFDLVGRNNADTAYQNLNLRAGASGMFINTNGRVGIGTTTPAAGLQVETVAGVSAGTWSYVTKGDFNSGSFAGSPSLAIYTSGAMGAVTYYAFSDARIKNVIGVSSGSKDLNTLRNIEVTDYNYKDMVANGSRAVKKVIAQQVESVYPQAVSKTIGVVPDIYKNTTHQDGWVKLATNLKVGERVKLVSENTQGVYEVLETRADAFRTEFKSASDQVFVVGHEVKDFRNVDYEAIAMLNVSATQELARKVDAQAAELKKLQAKLGQQFAEKETLQKHLAALEARDQAREDRLAQIESSLKKSSSKYASLNQP